MNVIGWVKDAHGLKGEVFIALAAGQADWDLNSAKLFLQRKNQSEVESFEAASLSPHKNGLIAKLPGVQSRDAAEALKGAQILIEAEALVSAPGERIFLGEILGFEVLDEKAGSLGPVTAFRSNGPQDLLVVRSGELELDIPFVDAFIKKIDFAGRRLYLTLPDGMLDVLRG